MTHPALTARLRRLLDPNQPAPGRPAGPPGWSGLYLGTGRRGPVTGGTEHHALVLGPPRSGKTTRLAIPNVRLHPGAVIATSTKPDIAAATHRWRAPHGTCWLWDPTGTTTPPADVVPLRWSPINGCEQWDSAVARAHALATAARPAHTPGDTHWVERAQALLAPLLHAAAITDGELADVLSWLHRRDLLHPISQLRTHRSDTAADLLEGIALTDPRELSGIFSTTDSLLAPYRTDAALNATRHPNFDPQAFARSTDTIYLLAPSTAQTQHAPLIICLLDQIRTHTYQTRPHPPMLWALDELANIAPLPDLVATIAEGASQGLLILACLQDLSQARTRWGPATDGLLTLFTHKLILPGIADLATLRQISALAGEHDQPVTSTSRTNHHPLGNRTTNTTPQRRPRLPLDTIATGHPNHALWLHRTTPHHVALPPWN
jgi:type IV secretion system protein VirD4